jgi:hypothetical protein
MKDQTIIIDEKVKSPNYSQEGNEWDSEVGTTRNSKKKRLKFTVKHESDSHDDYIQNYGNPLCLVRKDYVTLLVESKGDKISLKIFEGFRFRTAGKPYFIIDKSMEYITVNKKTGDVYYGNLKHYNKKKNFKKVFSKNHFHVKNSQKLLHTLKNRFYTVENHKDITNQFIDAVDVFVKNFSNWSPESKSLDDVLLKYYLDKKHLKYPNNFGVFWSEYVTRIPLKEIRKNNNKVVDAFMKKNDLKGGAVKKALHTCKRINVPMLNLAYFLFPEEWVNQDFNLIILSLEYDASNTYYNYDLGENIGELNLTKAELRKVFMIFKHTLSSHINLYTFFDHIRFYRELKILGEEVKWNANNLSTFNKEHAEFTEKVEYHKKGSYHRIYPEYMYELLGRVITRNNDKYYPVLLDETSNYVMESTIQSNCVKSYIGTSSSYIVSLRKGNVDSEERATIEFRLRKIDDTITFTTPQMLGRFNGKLSDEWNEPIQVLKTIFDSCLQDKRFEPVKIKKVFKNNKELISDTYWDDEGRLKWSSVDVTKYYE